MVAPQRRPKTAAKRAGDRDAGSAAAPVGLRKALAAGVVVAYYGIYLAPIMAGVLLDPSRAYWLVSGLALATAVVWLHERGGIAVAVALLVNSTSVVANLLLAVSLYVQGVGFNAQFFYHLDATTMHVAWSLFGPHCIAVGGYWVVATLWPRLLPRGLLALGPRRPGALAVTAVLALAVALNGAVLSLAAHAAAELMRANRIVLVPKPERAPEGGGPETLRDLVVVVAESLEATYARADVLGRDLTPRLTALERTALRFTDMRQVSHTGWTTGALVASWCGVPMRPAALFEALAGRADARMSGATCLGDVLAAAGYRTVFMVGHPLDFADVDGFLDAHGFAERFGFDALSGRLPDPSYRSGWGLYDDSLLALARDALDDLAADPRPFALAVLTMDTHFPPGFPSKACGSPPDRRDRTFVIRCADRLVADFIADVRARLPDAVVALYSDHLSAESLERAGLLPGSDGLALSNFLPRMEDLRPRLGVLDRGAGARRLRFAIWDGSREAGEIGLPGTHFDIMPTLLDALGFEAWTEHGFGTSLLRTGSPWLSRANPDALQIVHGVPDVRLAPDTPVTFSAHGPSIDIGGARLLATGRGLGLDDAAFAVAFDDDGRASGILGAIELERLRRRGDPPLVIGVSRNATLNRGLIGRDTPLTLFAGRIGTADFVARPLNAADGLQTVSVPGSR